MAEINHQDTLITRFNQSFVNLTQVNPTLYPATTAVRIDYATTPPITAYDVYDQFAFRVISLSAIQA